MKNSVRSIERHFSMLASAVTGYNVSVHLVDDKSHVGYTVMPADGKADITLSYTTDFYSGISEEQKEFYMMGVLAHECLHLVYTDFDAINSRTNALGSTPEKNLFHEINNVCEDPAIEYCAKNKVGGMMLKALDAVIAYTWKNAREINPEDEILNQIMSALIHQGDRGHYKGKMSDEATEVFNRVLPLFRRCIIEPVGRGRVEYSTDIYKILEEYLDKNFEPQSQMTLPQGLGEGEALPDVRRESQSGSSDDGAESSEESGSAGSAGEKDDNTSEGNKQNVQGGKADKSGAEEDSDDIADGDGSGEGEDEDVEITEDDINTLNAVLANLENEMVMEDKFKQSQIRKAAEDIPDDTDEVENQRVEDGNKELYDNIVREFDIKISVLADDLRKIFAADRNRVLKSNTGSRLNVKRIASPVLHEDVLLKRQSPKKLKDIAVYILIDSSGSMHSLINGVRNIEAARDTAICLYESLRKNKIPVFITGFSTSGSCASHKHYVTWNSLDGHNLTRLSAGGCNMDYYSIKDAAANLKKQPARHKILIVLSDGMPCSSYRVSNPIEATAEAVKNAGKHANVLGVAMNPQSLDDYTRMYRDNYIAVNTVDDMFLSIGKEFKKIVQSW